MKYDTDPYELAKVNVSTAIDQAHEYKSLADALQIYFDNLRDTLQEYGASGSEVDHAEQAFCTLASAQCVGWESEDTYSSPEIMQSDAVYATKGHAAKAPGLRGHSIGAMYPYTVIALGVSPVRYAAMDLRTGRTGQDRPTYAAAELDVYGLRIRNLIND